MVLRSPYDSISIPGTAGTLNDRNSRKRRSYHTRIRGIISANICPRSVYLGEHFPDSRLPGKDHEVIVMDDRDHAGFRWRRLSKGLRTIGAVQPLSCLRAAGDYSASVDT